MSDCRPQMGFLDENASGQPTCVWPVISSPGIIHDSSSSGLGCLSFLGLPQHHLPISLSWWRLENFHWRACSRCGRPLDGTGYGNRWATVSGGDTSRRHMNPCQRVQTQPPRQWWQDAAAWKKACIAVSSSRV